MVRARRKKKAKKAATRKGAKVWTAAQVATLRKMYKTSTNRSIGRTLRRTVGSVAAKARSLKLRKPKVRKKAATKRKPARRKATAKRRTTARRRTAPRRRKPARKRAAAGRRKPARKRAKALSRKRR